MLSLVHSCPSTSSSSKDDSSEEIIHLTHEDTKRLNIPPHPSWISESSNTKGSTFKNAFTYDKNLSIFKNSFMTELRDTGTSESDSNSFDPFMNLNKSRLSVNLPLMESNNGRLSPVMKKKSVRFSSPLTDQPIIRKKNNPSNLTDLFKPEESETEKNDSSMTPILDDLVSKSNKNITNSLFNSSPERISSSSYSQENGGLVSDIDNLTLATMNNVHSPRPNSVQSCYGVAAHDLYSDDQDLDAMAQNSADLEDVEALMTYNDILETPDIFHNYRENENATSSASKSKIDAKTQQQQQQQASAQHPISASASASASASMKSPKSVQGHLDVSKEISSSGTSPSSPELGFEAELQARLNFDPEVQTETEDEALESATLSLGNSDEALSSNEHSSATPINFASCDTPLYSLTSNGSALDNNEFIEMVKSSVDTLNRISKKENDDNCAKITEHTTIGSIFILINKLLKVSENNLQDLEIEVKRKDGMIQQTETKNEELLSQERKLRKQLQQNAIESNTNSEKLEEQISTLEDSLNNVSNKLEYQKALNNKLTNELTLKQSEIDSINYDLDEKTKIVNAVLEFVQKTDDFSQEFDDPEAHLPDILSRIYHGFKEYKAKNDLLVERYEAVKRDLEAVTSRSHFDSQKLKVAIEEKNETMKAFESLNKELKNSHFRLQTTLDLKDKLETNLLKLEEDFNSLKDKNSELENEIDEKNEDLKQVDNEFHNTKEELRKVIEKLKYSEVDLIKENELLVQSEVKLSEANKKLKNQKKKLEVEVEDLENRYHKSLQEIKSLEDSLNAQKESLMVAKDTINIQEERISLLDGKVKLLSTQADTLTESVEEKTNLIKVTNEKIDELSQVIEEYKLKSIEMNRNLDNSDKNVDILKYFYSNLIGGIVNDLSQVLSSSSLFVIKKSFSAAIQGETYCSTENVTMLHDSNSLILGSVKFIVSTIKQYNDALKGCKKDSKEKTDELESLVQQLRAENVELLSSFNNLREKFKKPRALRKESLTSETLAKERKKIADPVVSKTKIATEKKRRSSCTACNTSSHSHSRNSLEDNNSNTMSNKNLEFSHSCHKKKEHQIMNPQYSPLYPGGISGNSPKSEKPAISNLIGGNLDIKHTSEKEDPTLERLRRASYSKGNERPVDSPNETFVLEID